MKVYFKYKHRRKIPIPIPIPLWLIRMIISISTGKLVRSHIPEDKRKYWDCIDWDQLNKSLDIFKKYKGLKLVEVKVQDGTEITIIV